MQVAQYSPFAQCAEQTLVTILCRIDPHILHLMKITVILSAELVADLQAVPSVYTRKSDRSPRCRSLFLPLNKRWVQCYVCCLFDILTIEICTLIH